MNFIYNKVLVSDRQHYKITLLYSSKFKYLLLHFSRCRFSLSETIFLSRMKIIFSNLVEIVISAASAFLFWVKTWGVSSTRCWSRREVLRVNGRHKFEVCLINAKIHVSWLQTCSSAVCRVGKAVDLSLRNWWWPYKLMFSRSHARALSL